jgi:hypothetical protein
MKNKEHLKSIAKTIDPAVLDKVLGGLQIGDSNEKKAVVIAQAAFHSFFHS